MDAIRALRNLRIAYRRILHDWETDGEALGQHGRRYYFGEDAIKAADKVLGQVNDGAPLAYITRELADLFDMHDLPNTIVVDAEHV